MHEPIKIDVWSDIACPWCYIGKRKLERSITEYASRADAEEVEVEFHSYELLPEMPAEFDGSAVEFLRVNRGFEPDQIRSMHAQVTQVAAGVGLAYDFDIQRPTNTLKAHQLLHLAKAHGKQPAAAERLFAAHFVEGRHVGRDEDLADLGVEVGLDRDEVLTALRDQTYLEAVHDDIRHARELGIGGVPFFVVDGRYGISGAQSPETFTQALTTAHTERQGGTAA